MDKLQFEFTAKPAADGKSNVLCITSITTTEGRTFELQQVSLHIELCKTKTFAKVKNTIKKDIKKETCGLKCQESYVIHI